MDIILSAIIILAMGDLHKKEKFLGYSQTRERYSRNVKDEDGTTKALPVFSEGEAEPDSSILLQEYWRTQEMLIHYDNLNWQIGSILVGSNIVALGFLTGTGNTQLLFGAAIGGFVFPLLVDAVVLPTRFHLQHKE